MAAKRQCCGDIPHQRQDPAVSLRQHQGEAKTQLTRNKNEGSHVVTGRLAIQETDAKMNVDNAYE